MSMTSQTCVTTCKGSDVVKNAETPVFKLVLFGAESSLGSALMVELLSRQHEVTAVVDDLNRHAPRPGLHFKIGGLASADQAEQGAAGGSAVIALLPALAPGDLDYRQNGVTTNKNPPWSIKIRAVNQIFRMVRMRMKWMILQ